MPAKGLGGLAPPEDHELDEAVDGELHSVIAEASVGLSLQGARLDQCFTEDVRAHSRAYVQDLIEQGAVMVDGVVCRQASKRVRLGQRLRIEWRAPESEMAFVPEPVPLDVVFEDETLMVVNKPAGLVVHPAAGNWRGTLLNGLLAHHTAAAHLPRAGIVHRLDKDTSGLMVVAKTLGACQALVKAIAAREVQREYLALCHGAWKTAEAVELPIGRDPQSRVRMAVVPNGRAARTDFTPLAVNERFSLVHCKLHTGRTHQIRVHAASRRHPLVADGVYGGASALGMGRQALHATRLGLAHPTTKRAMQWQQPLPMDMQAACDSLWPDRFTGEWS